MKRSIVILLLGFLVGTSQGEGMFGNDWMKGLFDSINQLNANIQGNVQRINQDVQERVQRINQDVQEGVRNHLAQVESLNKDIAKTVGQSGAHTMTLGNSGTTILVNGAGGTSRTVFSGTSPNGEPYFRDSEDRVIGDVLHHTERVYNPARRSMDEYRYTLNLKDPNAKPVPVQS